MAPKHRCGAQFNPAMNPPSFWRRLSGNTRGALWMLAASLAFSGMAVFVKILGRTMSVWELAVLRSGFAIIVLSPALIRLGPSILATQRPGAHFVRSALGLGAMVTFFYAVTHLDLALVSALGFTRLLFVILLALLFLGEVIRWRRSLATIAGFVGVLVCLQPGTTAFDPWTLCALVFAAFTAGVTTMVKRLTFTETPLTILFWTYLVMAGLALAPAIYSWRTPTWEELGLIALMAVGSAAGQSCVVHGLRAGEVTAVTPYEYSRLLFAAVLGYLFFAEVPGDLNLVWRRYHHREHLVHHASGAAFGRNMSGQMRASLRSRLLQTGNSNV